jgi:predicted metal-dependent phosphotriesterase family hydrolase
MGRVEGKIVIVIGAAGGSAIIRTTTAPDWQTAGDSRPPNAPPLLKPVLKNIVPQLLAAGVTQAQIDEMFVGNPRRFFARAG